MFDVATKMKAITAKPEWDFIDIRTVQALLRHWCQRVCQRVPLRSTLRWTQQSWQLTYGELRLLTTQRENLLFREL
jgi:hypothetical protein